MKKLLIAMMSVASLAFISKAEAINSGTTFENYVGDFGADKDDRGGGDGTFWYTAGSQSECGTLTNINYTETYSGGRPAIAQGLATATALAVEAEQRLERGIANYSGGFAPQDIGSGIYFDTMVQFTATDIAPTPSQDDKLIVWLYGSADEDSAFGIGTNLVVTAGYLGTGNVDVTLKHYLNTNESIVVEPNSWHRLTIKAISDIGASTSQVAGFVVFIDGVAVTSTEDKANADANTVFKNLSSVGAKWNTLNALFPSLVAAGNNNCQTLSAVALEGTGMIDDISFTSDAPRFAKDAAVFTLKWDDGVETLSYSVNDGAAITVDTSLAAQAVDITIERAGTTVAVAATYKSGYQAGAWTTSNANATLNETTWTVNDVSVGTVVSQQALFEVNGMAYANFTAALNAMGNTGTIKVLANVDMSAASATVDQYIEVAEGQNLVLDLNGKTIKAGYKRAASVVVYGSLAITNSSETVGCIEPFPEGQTAITVSLDGEVAGSLVVYDRCKIMGPIEIDANKGASASLVGGIFFDSDYTAEGDPFYLNSYVASGSAATYSGDKYFTVASASTPEPDPEPTTYALTVPEVTGATAAVTKAGVAVTDLTKIAKGTTVVVTWTATEGYKITAGATEQITMDAAKAATAPTVKAIQYATVTITPVDNCTITVKNGETAVATGAKFDIDDKVTLTVTRTPADGYELDNCQTPESVTLSEAKEYTITAAVKPVSSGKTYPTYIPAGASEATKAKFDTWSTSKAGGDRDTASANMEAFLLNVAPNAVTVAAEKANFKVTAITVNADGSVTVTTTTQNSSGQDYNGTVKVKGKVNLTDPNATWVEKNATHKFFKAFLEVE